MKKVKHGRPKSDKSESTAFGRFLTARRISYDEAALELGTTRSYINQLATGSNHSGPSFKLICAIRDFAKSRGGSVPVTSWEK